MCYRDTSIYFQEENAELNKSRSIQVHFFSAQK
jgi:hypothetical protein